MSARQQNILKISQPGQQSETGQSETVRPRVHYPESDGKPMGETDLHMLLIIYLRTALDNFFSNQPDVLIGSNLLFYYEEGNPKKVVVPDVFMVRGVSKGSRRIYKLWEEKLPPTVVFEIMSRSTWGDDLQRKWKLYERLGVQEYYLFDPERDVQAQLSAFRLAEDGFRAVKLNNGSVYSESLGLELLDDGTALRLRDPKTGEFLLSPHEEFIARQREAEARQREAEARQQAEVEIAQLKAELERLRQQIKEPGTDR
jgi:Uma2 family endonuclease